MANKLKLVFLNKNLAETKAWLKALSTGTPDWTSSTNEFYRSLVFTQDGHLLTHGIDFNPVASLGPGLLFNPTSGTTNVSDPGTVNNAIPVFNKLSNSLIVSWVNRSTFVEYPSGGFTTGAVLIGNGTSTPTTRAIVTAGASDTSGLITENAVINNFIPYPAWTSGDTNKYILIQTAAKNVTKYKLLDDIDNLATTDTTSLLTGLAVKNAIADAFEANDAMQFAGTYIGDDERPITSVVGGTFATTPDIIKLGRGCTWRVSIAGYFGLNKVEVGDLIIAIQDSISAVSGDDPAKYTIILANIDGALTTANLGGTNNESKRKVYQDNQHNLYVDLLFRTIYVNNSEFLDESTYGSVNFEAGESLKINDSDYTIKYEIDNTIAAQTTQGLYKIKHNALGLITGSAAWDPKSLTFSNVRTAYNVSTGSSNEVYDPDGASGLSITAARGLVFWKSNNIINIGHSSTKSSDGAAVSGQYISALTLDDYGHVTGITRAQDINTWRPVNAYLLLANGSKLTTLLSTTPSSVGTADLTFGSEFVFAGTETIGSESGNEIHLVWAEVDSNGNITYAV